MIEGGCYCGQVRYVSEGAPFHETICHCVDCRRVTGAANVAWFSAPASGFRFTAQAPMQHRSSANVIRTFCGVCGTALTYQRTDLPDEVDVTIASADHPDRLAPGDHVRTSSRLAWDAVCDGLPTFSGSRSAGTS